MIPSARSRRLAGRGPQGGALGCCAQRRRLRGLQGVFGACVRWCPGSRALGARRASVSALTRTRSEGTRRFRYRGAGPSQSHLSYPSLPSWHLTLAGRRGRLGGDCGTAPHPPSPLAGTHTETGWRREAKAPGLRKKKNLNGGEKQSCSDTPILLESCKKSWGSSSPHFVCK